ncbi:MAG: 50S ribosomal protein L25/general stress protein Ctc [Gammaproteobacteria bacterium]|jgi:large subunit ribosomal protein L25|nr:MAG: 50S ribosomal protein L25/general stress protein Ctc [Gammaproteobacteria bacterium]
MQLFEINAEPRQDVGKGASRRLRKSGKVPGILYGAHQEAALISVDQNKLLHQLDNEAFYSHILTLTLGAESGKVVLKDLQRHPYKLAILHVDFQRVSETEELTMRIPIHFINEGICVGVKTGGGVVSHILSDIEITCLPKHLPEYIEVDLTDVNVGESVHLGDLKLPDGVRCTLLVHGGDPHQAVASVHIPRAAEVETVAEPGVEAAAAPEAGAAPAAESKG